MKEESKEAELFKYVRPSDETDFLAELEEYAKTLTEPLEKKYEELQRAHQVLNDACKLIGEGNSISLAKDLAKAKENLKHLADCKGYSDQALNTYIKSNTKLKARIKELEKDNERLKNLAENLESIMEYGSNCPDSDYYVLNEMLGRYSKLPMVAELLKTK